MMVKRAVMRQATWLCDALEAPLEPPTAERTIANPFAHSFLDNMAAASQARRNPRVFFEITINHQSGMYQRRVAIFLLVTITC